MSARVHVSVVTHVPDVGLSSVSSSIPVAFLFKSQLILGFALTGFPSPKRVKLTSWLKGHCNDF